MNVSTTHLWYILSRRVWADVSSPQPHFEQTPLPPPEPPPYVILWPKVWLIVPILLILAVLFIRARNKQKKA